MYRHTQPGTVLLATVAAALALLLLVLFVMPIPPGEEAGRWILAAAGMILLAIAVLFRSLTIAIHGGTLTWSFGPGLIRKSVPVAEIAHVEPTRTTVLAGWGIHWTPRGWLYNVSGMHAVQVKLKSGKQFLLGTDEPEQLVRAIQAAQRPGPV